MSIVGKIKSIGSRQNFDTKNGPFEVIKMVVKTEDKFPQHYQVEFTGDNIDLVEDCTVGDMVTIQYNLSGREWKDPQGNYKYFTSIRGWDLKKGTEVKNEDHSPDRNNEPDDLPF
jgi:hypothetical protein